VHEGRARAAGRVGASEGKTGRGKEGSNERRVGKEKGWPASIILSRDPPVEVSK